MAITWAISVADKAIMFWVSTESKASSTSKKYKEGDSSFSLRETNYVDTYMYVYV